MDINGLIETALRELRHAVRALAKAPVFTATVVLTLGLGIGANSAVFSAIYAVLLRPLPFPDADRIVKLAENHPKVPEQTIAPIRLEDWNRLNSTFQAITGYYTEDVSELSGALPERLRHAHVAPRFLEVLGVAPAQGRGFSPQEERYGGPAAALISNRLWRRRFGANPIALGKALRIGTVSFTIVGVMPASFLFPDRDVDLWTPIPSDAPYAQRRDAKWYVAIGRMKPGITPEQARANLAQVQAGLAKQYPRTDSDIAPAVAPLKDVTVAGVRKSLWMLFGSVSLLLLIACTNIAALLLSRVAARQHEISIRFSLGASKASVVVHLLTEVLVLALAGGSLGLLVAAGASRVFRALARDLPRIDEIGLDWRIVLYSLVCALAATLLCGTLPAIRGTRRNLAGSLARAGRSQVQGRNPVQFVLVGVQVSLAVALLAGAGLLLRSFQELGRVSPGFDAERVLTFHISSSWQELAVDQKAARQRVDRILEGIRELPGVVADATSVDLPGVPSQYPVEMKTVEGRAETEPKMIAEERQVTASYFATMRIPLLAGQMCRDDLHATHMMVNRSFAGAYFGGAGAIGHHLVRAGSSDSPWEIRGIVGDARETGLEREPGPAIYWCAGSSQPGSFFLVRTRSDPTSMAAAIRRKVHEVEPTRSVYDVTPLLARISDAYAENRLRTILLAFFAATAVALASVGLYGTLSYLVRMRRREVGLRLAMGAARTQIVQQFLMQGLRVSLLGCTAGLALAAILSRVLSGMLYGVSAWDPETLGGVIAIVLAVSVVASLLPAVRASRVEPMHVLREE